MILRDSMLSQRVQTGEQEVLLCTLRGTETQWSNWDQVTLPKFPEAPEGEEGSDKAKGKE